MKTRLNISRNFLFSIACGVLASGCYRKDEPGANEPVPAERAEAALESADGQDIEGEVKFYAATNGVRIVAKIEDAKPGKHGFHIHEKGDCSDIAGKSMGHHFAPEGHQHALPEEGSRRHLGDLGNIEVDQNGNGHFEMLLTEANLKPGDRKSLLGRAVVVHEGEDSGSAKQPAGDSGDPIACGIIKKG